MAEHTHTTSTYHLGAHPRRTDHPTLLAADGTAAGPIVGYVRMNLEHLDHDACALSVVVDAAEKFIRDHDESILACALRSASRVLGSGIGDLQDDLDKMVQSPTYNPAAALVLGTAGLTTTTESDAPLLALAADLDGVQAALDAMNADRTQDIDDAFNNKLGEFWEVANNLVEIPARTPKGLRGKAKALGMVYRSLGESEDSHVGRHLLGLVRDLVGEG